SWYMVLVHFKRAKNYCFPRNDEDIKMQKFSSALIVLLSCWLLNPVSADPIADIYQVEVIVFEHMDAQRFRSENWPKHVTKIDHERAINLDALKNNAPESLD